MKTKPLVVTIYILLGILLLLVTVYFTRLYLAESKHNTAAAPNRIIDEAHILDDPQRMNPYLDAIYDESDVDIHLVFLQDLGGRAIEEVANDKAKELKIGSKSRDDRGVLILFDLADQQFRIEVGYALEEYLPDAFVSYLISNHTKEFFASGSISVGLRLMIRIMHHRIREAILGRKFDPSILTVLARGSFQSGGAGATGATPIQHADPTARRDTLSEADRSQFLPQNSPEAAYQKYVEWAVMGKYDPRITLFTLESRGFLSGLEMSKAYFDFILLQEYGRQYKIETRQGLALQYFTDDPLVSPHFFVKTDSGWQMDIGAEVRNTHDINGTNITWTYSGKDDNYSTTFADIIIQFGKVENGYILRIRGGDNRLLPTRQTSGNLANAADTGPTEEEISGYIENNLPPHLKGVLAKITGERFDSVLELYAGLQSKYEKKPLEEGELDLALDLIYLTNADLNIPLIHFAQQHPQSYVPYLLRGIYYVNRGYKARGSRYRSETSDEQIEGMSKYFDKALANLDTALSLNPRLIHAYSYKMNCLVSFGDQRPEIEAIYRKGLSYNPLSYKLRYNYMTMMEPKWGGSISEMEEFAKECEQSSKDNPALGKLKSRVNSSLGDRAWSANDYAEAVKYFQLAAADGYGMYQAWELTTLGRFAANNEDYAAARKYLMEAIKVRPTSPDAYGYFAQVERLEAKEQ